MKTEALANVRQATAGDVPEMLLLADEFHSEVINSFGFHFDPAIATKFALTQLQGCFVLEAQEGEEKKIVGLIAGSVIVYPGSGEQAFVESIWYVRKEYRSNGMKLLETLEAWCIANGIKNLVMALMESDKAAKIGRFYERCGYRPFERQYVKNL